MDNIKKSPLMHSGNYSVDPLHWSVYVFKSQCKCAQKINHKDNFGVHKTA